MYTEEQVIKALELKAPHDEVAREALRIIESKNNFVFAADLAFREIYKQLGKANLDLERYGRRIREQKKEILDLLSELHGAIARQETLHTAIEKAEKCVSCGDVIPEGRQVCPTCENAKGEKNDTSKQSNA